LAEKLATQIEITSMDEFLKNMMIQQLQPSREEFSGDPFGYSANAWTQWVIAAQLHNTGHHLDLEKPSSEDLKQPFLWLSQSKALTVAAISVIESDEKFEEYEPFLRGIADSQLKAVGLMLFGFSLEVSLKGMIIIKEGTNVYLEREKAKKTFTHNLVNLAKFIPELTDKDKAILKQFTQFLVWAGRYPDPGFNRMDNVEDIHKTSEQYEITMRDALDLVDKIMKHVTVVMENQDDAA